jgi:signal transduction histidine kinase
VKFEYFEERLTGRWAISFWQWLFCAPLSIYVSYDRIVKLTELSVKQSLIISFLDIIFAGVSFVIAAKFILRDKNTVRQSLDKVFFAYVFISLFDSFCEMASSALLFGQKPLIGTQFMTPIFPNFIALVATATLVSEFSHTNQRLKVISDLNQELLLNESAINEELEREKNQLISSINNFLIPQLDKVKKAFESAKLSVTQSDKLLAIEAIEQFANNSVRTLSHDLYSREVADFEHPKLIAEKRTKVSSEVYQPLISVKLVIVFGVLIGGSQQLSLNGLKGFLYDLVAIGAITIANLFASLIIKMIHDKDVEYKYYIFIFHIFLVGNISAIFFTYLQNDIFNLEYKYGTAQVVFRNVLNVLISSAIVTLVQGREQLSSTIESLNQKVNSQLVVRKRLLADLRMRIASVLHGQIQGRLSGIALALRVEEQLPISVEKEKEIAKIVALIENDLSNLLQSVSQDDKTDLSEGIADVIREWQAIVNIELTVELDEESIFDKTLTRNVKLALNEAIANAVRHGRARNIQVIIKRYRKSSNNLHLLVINDGIPIPEDRTPGLGFKNLDISTADWKITNLDTGQVSVEAII